MLLREALAYRLRVDSGDHNVPRLSFQRSVHNGDVTTKNTGPGHAVPFDPHQVHVWRTKIQKLIERNLLLEMVSCRGPKAGWHAVGIEREMDTARRLMGQGP